MAALDIVAEQGPINATQLGRVMAIDRTVARRLLSTLHSGGFVLKLEAGYVLGPSLLRLSERVAPGLQNVALPIMRDVAEESGETVLCHLRQGDDAIVLAQVVGRRHPVRVEEEIGRYYPLQRGAGGLAILATLNHVEADTFLDTLSATDRAETESALAPARELGYAVSHGKRRAGVRGIAAAVVLDNGLPICSISVVVPDQRADLVPGLIPLLLSAVSRFRHLLDGDDDHDNRGNPLA